MCIRDRDEINLVDKINLHFKSGAFTPIDFAPEHEYLVDLTGNAETFEDAVEAAVEIYKVMQEIEEQKEQEKIGESNDENQEGGQGQVEDGESMDFEETPDQEIINPNQPWDQGEQVQQEGQVPSGTRSGGVDYDPFQSQTDDAFTQGTKDLTEEPRYGRENVYVELPKKLNPDHFIVGADYLLKVNQNHFSVENDLKEEGKKESYDRTVEEYNLSLIHI